MRKKRAGQSACRNLWVLICLVLVYTAAISARANVITVTNTSDSGPGSLRQALADANDGDTIDFELSLKGQTITLTTAELAIDKSITISGPGRDLLTVSMSGLQYIRIFHVMPGHSVTIDGLTVGDTPHFDSCTGGILNDHGTLTLSNCAVQENCAQAGGGIYNDGSNGTATLTVLSSTVTLNGLFDGDGGGIYNDNGTCTIVSSEVNYNSATSKGECDVSVGGGIYSRGGTLEITNSTISGNHVNVGAGGIYTSGTTNGTITNSIIDRNTAQPTIGPCGIGGGIWAQGPLLLSGCTVSNNVAQLEGGGIFGAFITISNCTISGNRAESKHSPPFPPVGGGIYGGALEISNSTISGNSAAGGGGGIYNGSGDSTISYCTLTGNSGINGGAIDNQARVQIKTSILNTGDFGPNIFNNGGTVVSSGYNLSDDDGSGFLKGPGDQINTDPMLGPLQDNGGPTFTHALLPGSPAIDMGDPNFTPPPFFDQRGPGFVRVFNGRIDVGSFEVQLTPTPTATATATPTATATHAPTATPTPTSTATATASSTSTPRPSPTPRPVLTPRPRPTPPPRP